MIGQKEAEFLWDRAVETMKDAEEVSSANGKGNRAYYAAFYAVSALLSLDGMTFKTHKAVEGAVHQRLVNSGRWSVELGDTYKRLHRLRIIGDYGWFRVVPEDEAKEAVAAAWRILRAVHDAHPDMFPLETP
ncbi:MAG: HEPN domain-containing protein [bacterium]